MKDDKFSITISQSQADKIFGWFKTGKGVAVWNSLNLSDPGKQWLTPAVGQDGNPYPKPTWQVGNTADFVIIDPQAIGVNVYKEVKRFHVAVRMGRQGMSLKVTDAGTRRIRAAVEKAGPGAFYTFDYGDEKNAVIMIPAGEPKPLDEVVKV